VVRIDQNAAHFSNEWSDSPPARNVRRLVKHLRANWHFVSLRKTALSRFCIGSCRRCAVCVCASVLRLLLSPFEGTGERFSARDFHLGYHSQVMLRRASLSFWGNGLDFGAMCATTVVRSLAVAYAERMLGAADLITSRNVTGALSKCPPRN
jgi:hypothetical protein